MTKGSKNNIEIDSSANGDNVDTIRDILFGSQMREFEQKHAQLQEHIAENISSLRQENRSQIDNLQAYLESETEIANSKVEAEQTTREHQLDELEASFQKGFKQLDKKIEELAKALESHSQETNKKLLKLSQDFNTEIIEKAESLQKRSDSQNKELSTTKVDKNMLAEMLNALALQLTNEG